MQKRNFIDMAKFQLFFWLAVALLALVFVSSLAIGRYAIPFGEAYRILLSKIFPISKTWSNLQEAVVMNLRLPRTVAAVVIGSGLAVSGATYQGIFKNPMASPDLLGVAWGACVGAAISILLNFGSALTQLCAFVGGLAAVGLTMLIPRLIRNESTTILVLAGIVVGSLMQSILNFIKFIADGDNSRLAEITYWQMGSVATVTFAKILPVLPAILGSLLIILFMRFRLNILSLGDDEAKSLGINLRTTRGIFIICSTIITAGCACLAGTVMWLGLIIPHTARMIVGADNKKMLPISMVFGAIFLLVIDVLCRTVTSSELRLGILTGLIGAPFFIFILIKQRGQVK